MAKFNSFYKEQKAYLILLFLVSPLMGLWNLFKIKNEKEITFFGTLFFGLLGSAYIYYTENDGYRHRELAKEYYLDMSIVEFFKKSYNILIFSPSEGADDLYLHVISYLSASLLQTPELIHFFSGIVLGYFFTKSVLLLLKGNLRVKKNHILLVFIFLFLLIKSVSALNSIRMWTGMWVFFYGTYGWAATKEKKYLYVIFLSILVHFSYVVILIPAVAAYVIRERKRLLVFIYIVSFFTTLGFSAIESYIPKSDLMETKQDQYAIDSEEKAERFEKRYANLEVRNDKKNFYSASGQSNYVDFSIVGLTIILLFFYLKNVADTNLISLVSIGMGLYAFSNLVAFSPSLQGRTKMIGATFLLAAAIHLQLTLKNYHLGIKTKWRLNLGLVTFLISSTPMVLYQISYILQGFSFFLLLFPQASWIMGDNDFSMREAIGLIID
jgi:hypothetical protein